MVFSGTLAIILGKNYVWHNFLEHQIMLIVLDYNILNFLLKTLKPL